MWLVLAFQSFYVTDGLYNEPAIFTTMDITTDGFGFMLAIGDLTWVPFVYSLQARYLVFNQVELNWYQLAGILAVNALGYYIFRTANGEKNDFRNGRNPKSAQSQRLLHTYANCANRPSVLHNGIGLEASDLRVVGSVEASKLFVCLGAPMFSYLLTLIAAATFSWLSRGRFQRDSRRQSPISMSHISPCC